MRYWWMPSKGEGAGRWQEVSERVYRDCVNCLDFWMRRDGAVPSYLDGAGLLALPEGSHPEDLGATGGGNS